MASNFALAGPFRANLLLPSVLVPKRQSASMSISDAMKHIQKQLSMHPKSHSEPRRVTIVLYEPKGSPIVHVGTHDECMIYDSTMLEDLVNYVQKTLDVRTSTSRSMSGQTSQRYDKLLVSSFEFRFGAGALNYPAVAGTLVGGAVNDLKPWGFDYAGVMWPEQGSTEYLYFELYREVLMRGINVTMNTPILKVKTVERALITADNIGRAGHHFFQHGVFEDEGRAGRSEYLDTNREGLTRALIKNEMSKNLNHPGGYSAQFAETLLHKKPKDMAWDAPEFKLLGLYMESLKNRPNVNLELVYDLHIFSGEKPIKALVPKGKGGHDNIRPNEYVWVDPEHPDYPDGADDSSTVKARSDSAPEDMMKDSEYQSLDQVQPHEVALMKYHEEKKSDAVGFEDVDDETYFPAAGKFASVKVTPESLDKVNKNPRRPVRIRSNSRVEKTTAMNMKVLTQFQQTVASSSGTSPVRAFASLYDTPTSSPKTGPNIIQLSRTNTPVLQHGVPNFDRAKSPLKQNTSSAKQLRAESPAFNFDNKNKLADEVPAVSSLLRTMQIQGVKTARTREVSHAEAWGDNTVPGYQNPLSDTAISNPMIHQQTIDQQHNIGSGQSVLMPAYHTHDGSFRPQSQPASTSMEASMSSGQPHSQTPVNSSTSSPFYQNFGYPQTLTSMVSQTQNLAAHSTQRAVRVPVGRHRQPHPTLQAPRPTFAGTPRFHQPQLHQQTNHNYFQTPPAGPASMSSTHVPAAHTPSQHANAPNATVFSHPPLAHPQPKVSANVASAFSIYQSKMDGQGQAGAKDTSGEPASGQESPFTFTFSS